MVGRVRYLKGEFVQQFPIQRADFEAEREVASGEVVAENLFRVFVNGREQVGAHSLDEAISTRQQLILGIS